MPADILVTPHELRQQAHAINAQVAATTSDVNAMRSRLQTLSTEFRGHAAEAFEARWEDWQAHANGLIHALEGLGRFLLHSAETIEDVDRDLAHRIDR